MSRAEPRPRDPRFDRPKIEAGVRLMLEGMGIDPDGEGVRDTPGRLARMYEELFSGLGVDPVGVLDVFFEENHDELVLIRDIPFSGICEHHLLPFIGRAHIGYLPNERGQVTGLSKIARVVDVASSRPSLQERLTTSIADALEQALSPRGVIVIMEAEHSCMTVRGVRKPGAITVTSAVRGRMRSDPRTRGEALALISGGRPFGS